MRGVHGRLGDLQATKPDVYSQWGLGYVNKKNTRPSCRRRTASRNCLADPDIHVPRDPEALIMYGIKTDTPACRKPDKEKIEKET